jgi:hypothetical protein
MAKKESKQLGSMSLGGTMSELGDSEVRSTVLKWYTLEHIKVDIKLNIQPRFENPKNLQKVYDDEISLTAMT